LKWFFSFCGIAITTRNNIQDYTLPAYLLSCDLSSKFIIPLSSVEAFPYLLGYILVVKISNPGNAPVQSRMKQVVIHKLYGGVVGKKSIQERTHVKKCIL